MTIRRNIFRIALAVVALVAVVAGLDAQPPKDAAPDAPRPLAKYQAGPYVVYTDLQPPRIWSALARLEHMADLYRRQTAGFDRDIQGPLTVFLYSSGDDYLTALGDQAAYSAGIYTGGELRAITDIRTFSRESIWHVIQHEGFHQVAHRVIAQPGAQLPLWLNEGLAEYFGEALWTGTRLLPGAVDAGKVYSKVPVRGGRAGRIRRRFAEGSFREWPELLSVTAEQWRTGRGSTIDYDQVYALVHYLIHGEGGKHRPSFAHYVNAVARGRANLPTFKKHFGRDIDALGEACRQWWLHLSDQPTAEIHAIVAAETLANALARAENPQAWSTAADFLQAARNGKVKLRPGRAMHLPPWLITQAATAAEHLGTWTLTTGDASATLTVTLTDGEAGGATYGKRISATVALNENDKPAAVSIETTPPPTTQPATAPAP